VSPKNDGREFIRVEDSLPVRYALLGHEDYEKVKKELEERGKGTTGLISFPAQTRYWKWEKLEGTQQDSIVIQMLLGIHQKLDKLLKLLEKKEDSPFQEGLATDISGSGMRLKTDREFQPGDILHLKFDLPIIPPTTLEVLGKVMWVNSGEATEYYLGIHFISINEEDRDLIIRYTFLKQRMLLKERRKDGIKN